MAEEEKKDMEKKEEKKPASEAAKTFLKIVLGLIFVLGGLALVVVWWKELLSVIKGTLGLFLIMVGAIILAIAKE
ncbi:MAG: hypothetical protein J7J25_00295 [Candidatus Omnitrophica bacterium]|nr:hypothetical protein [Candidatus Omnitrophota bacterium]